MECQNGCLILWCTFAPSLLDTDHMIHAHTQVFHVLCLRASGMPTAFVLPISLATFGRPDDAARMSATRERGTVYWSTTERTSANERDAYDFESDDQRTIESLSRSPQRPASRIGQLFSRLLPRAALIVLGGGWLGSGSGRGGFLNDGGWPYAARAEDELAQYAKEGNKVGVDAKCFVQKCSLSTHDCLNNPDCLKGLSCLSKCKGEGTCSTACFAKYGNGVLDNFLHCAVEQQDCVHVPRDRSRATWTDPDTVGLDKQISPSFQISSLEGRWYKVMGMDARYDCFDCQVNHFSPKPGGTDTMLADVSFRMPRPRAPGFWENHITEELLGDGSGAHRSMHSVGRMFGLTFWENWYVIGENTAEDSELPAYKFVYYTGHTLQGNYEGAFVYARTPELPPELMSSISRVARANGLDPTKFCKIRNACFRPDAPPLEAGTSSPVDGMKLTTVAPTSFAGIKGWLKTRALWLPRQVSELKAAMTRELDDWFEDPTKTSDWLMRQQERMIMVADEPRAGAVQVIASRTSEDGNGGDKSGDNTVSTPLPAHSGAIAAASSTVQLDSGKGSRSTSGGGLPPVFVDYLAKKSP